MILDLEKSYLWLFFIPATKVIGVVVNLAYLYLCTYTYASYTYGIKIKTSSLIWIINLDYKSLVRDSVRYFL